MRIIKKCRIHDAIVWPMLGDSGRGYYEYGNPIEIKCRWDDIDSQQFEEDGVSFRCRAEIIADRRIKVGDLMLRGKLDDVVGDTSDPQSIPNIGAVRRVEINTTLRNPDNTDYDKTVVAVYLGNRYGR